jgi:hypothetical protein
MGPADPRTVVIRWRQPYADAELYDPRTGAWTATRAMVHDRFARQG